MTTAAEFWRQINEAEQKRKTAHGIKRTGLAHVEGKHLSEAPNEEQFTPPSAGKREGDKS